MKLIQYALDLEPTGLTEKVLMINNCNCTINFVC